MPLPALSGLDDAGFLLEGGRAGPLRVEAATGPGPVFERFFAAYDRAFVLPDEKENRDGFLQCLALNRGPARERLLQRHGPYAEWVLVATDAGAVVGGANFICHALRGHGGWPALAMNLNYVFVAPDHRGRGHLRSLVEACRRLARMSFAGADVLALYLFIELNDPLLMDAGAYALDSEVAGIDQFDRVAVWARLGARLLDFDYVQPPLAPGRSADRGLMLGVVDPPDPRLDACVLGGHLERFFAISVLKDGDPYADPLAATQLHDCARRCADGQPIGLLDPRPSLDALRPLAGRGGNGQGLRTRLAAAAAAGPAPRVEQP